MLVKRLAACEEIIARDHCRLRELLHPARDAAALPYSLAVAWVDPGQRTRPHRLRQTEVYYLIRGEGRMHIGGEARAVAAGDAVVISADQAQWIENTGAGVLEFAAIVSPPWRAEDDVEIPK